MVERDVTADLVRIIEAVYALDQSETDWVEGICSAARPALDAGLGIIGAAVDISSGTPMYSAGAAVGNTLEAFRAWGGTQPENADDATLPLRGPPTQSLIGIFGDRLSVAVPNFSAVSERFGIKDAFSVIGMNPDGHGFGITALLPERARFGAGIRERWDRVAAHLAAGVRLRRRLLPTETTPSQFTLRVEGVDALLTPNGRIVHAMGTARETTTREQLRDAAVALDRARGELRRSDPDRALVHWKALVDGRWSLFDRFDTDGRRFLLAHRNEVPARRLGLRRREAAVLALRAQGHSIKLICYELGLAQSLVARDLTSGMKRLGLDSLADLMRLYARRVPCP